MRVVLVGNIRSGRGRAKRLFVIFRDALERAGYTVTQLALGEPGFEDAERFDPRRFRGASAVIACGGDGTVNAIAGSAAATATPVYHVPAGNENLFARTFHMSADPGRLVRALQTRRVLWTDTGVCDGDGFLVMASFGPDAGVIHRLHAARTRSLGHLVYLEPILSECRRPTLQPMTIAVDGEVIARERPGWLIVANSPQYASRINFGSRASPTSGTFDIAFMPAETVRDCVNWIFRAWTRQHRRDPRLIQAEGGHVSVSCPTAPLVRQFDGEAPTASSPRHTADIRILPRRLPVLCPQVPGENKLPAAV